MYAHTDTQISFKRNFFLSFKILYPKILLITAIGRRVDVTERKQQLKATMWLAEGYPLSLTDQLLPIVELMALNNTHFEKLKDFLTLQVPSGFPVKIGQ